MKRLARKSMRAIYVTVITASYLVVYHNLIAMHMKASACVNLPRDFAHPVETLSHDLFVDDTFVFSMVDVK